ncbi:hypothetical protein NE626_15935, partial [Intestinimonas massiliensis]|nr:hypothetical protein [Intestinimonas massiliensis (ex Afouda et al. 2020)]
RLYEDSVGGRISDERFTELSADYEAEQQELKERVARIQAESAAEIKIVTSAPVFAKRLPALFRKAFKVDFDRSPEPAETDALTLTADNGVSRDPGDYIWS